MICTYGNYIEHLPKIRESLELRLGTYCYSNQERWQNNIITAQFCGQYFAAFLASKDLESSISYIANEILENALKFHRDSSQQIGLNLYLLDQKIILTTVNNTDRLSCTKLEQIIEKVLAGDLQSLYLEQIESNATNNNNESGLGLITIAHDHQALLGWKIQNLPNRDDLWQITTMAQLTI